MNAPTPERPLRCAIYTRKSTEEGLQQDFNSLQAQRESAEAYITSQKRGGWTMLETAYDDGGFTGANLERPALKQLLSDIAAGRIDCVVVYKVDRLSRSLLDFARLMEVFERHQVSFVSVTQELHTTSSLGRLTLHILLSFAQFERELISERTRDKLGAARRKGKWIGGIPVLGFSVAPGGGKLVVETNEAMQVRQIFAIAAAGQSLTETLSALQSAGMRTKQWVSSKGRAHGGKPFHKSTLGALLRNVLYIGEISHKGVRYPGEQPALVDRELWERVHEQLHRTGGKQRGRPHAKLETILGDLVSCGQCGGRLLPTYASRRGQRYVYYQCAAAKRRTCQQKPVSGKLLEEAIVSYVQPFLVGAANSVSLRELMETVGYDSSQGKLQIQLRNGSRTQIRLNTANKREPDSEPGRIPRISRLMALAIKMERQVRAGEVSNYRALAAAGELSRPRMSQIIALTQLSPAIQERLLFLPRVREGRDRITEKSLRAITRQVDWSWQEQKFEELVKATNAEATTCE